MTTNLAILIPYRNRPDHLARIVPHLISYFHRDKVDSLMVPKPLIVIAEQADDLPFNRGALLNAAFLVAERRVDYVCFHDVDYLPIWADYSKPEGPTRIVWWGMDKLPMRVNSTEESNIVLAPRVGLGTVTLFPTDQFWSVNGFSNLYCGWGFEDTDLLDRSKNMGLTISQRDGTFEPIYHDSAGYNDDGSKSPAWIANEQRYQDASKSYKAGEKPAEGLSTFNDVGRVLSAPPIGLEMGLDWKEQLQVLHLKVKFKETK